MVLSKLPSERAAWLSAETQVHLCLYLYSYIWSYSPFRRHSGLGAKSRLLGQVFLSRAVSFPELFPFQGFSNSHRSTGLGNGITLNQQVSFHPKQLASYGWPSDTDLAQNYSIALTYLCLQVLAVATARCQQRTWWVLWSFSRRLNLSCLQSKFETRRGQTGKSNTRKVSFSFLHAKQDLQKIPPERVSSLWLVIKIEGKHRQTHDICFIYQAEYFPFQLPLLSAWLSQRKLIQHLKKPMGRCPLSLFQCGATLFDSHRVGACLQRGKASCWRCSGLLRWDLRSRSSPSSAALWLQPNHLA